MRLFVKIGIIVLTILLGFVMLLATLTWVYQDRLKSAAINTINENVKSPIKVKNGIDISFLRHFPKIDVALHGVSIQDPLNASRKLLEVERFSLLVNFYELFDATISIRKAVFENGSVYLYRSQKGASNFDILKSSGDGESADLKLNAVIFKNVKLIWNDRSTDSYFSGKVDNATFSGDFKKQQFAMALKADFFAELFIYGSDSFTLQKQTALDFKTNVNRLTHKIEIQNSTLSIGGNAFDIAGEIATHKNASLKLHANCKGTEIAQLLDLMPNSQQKKLQGLKGSGAYEIAIDFDNKNKLSPIFNLDASLAKGEISLPQLPHKIKNIDAKLRYSKQDDKLVIERFSSSYDQKPIRFSLIIHQLTGYPSFELSADGIANLMALERFLPDAKIEAITGELQFTNFRLAGKADKSKKLIPSALEGSGAFKIKDASVTADGVKYDKINGGLAYKNEHLFATDLQAVFLGSDLKFNGQIDNLFPYIFEKVKRDGQTILLVSGSLQIGLFDLNKMLAAFDKQDKKAAAEKINIRDIFSISGQLKLSVDEFKYQQLNFKHIISDIRLSSGVIHLDNFHCKAMGGDFDHKGFIKFTADNELQVSGDLTVRSLDIVKLFEQAENFGQQTLTAKNLKGKINADLSFNAYFDDYKTIDLRRLVATLRCNISSGELIAFEPIKIASKFIRLEELDHIYFSDLSNELIIKNGVITIPQMEVQSSAINVMMNGTHTFENQIDYHLKINLRKLLANKFRKNNAEQYIEEDAYEGTNLFLSIKGDMKNPAVSYDKSAANNKIKDDFKTEKETLRNLFKKENETNKKPDIKEEKYFQTREEIKYIDFDE